MRAGKDMDVFVGSTPLKLVSNNSCAFLQTRSHSSATINGAFSSFVDLGCKSFWVHCLPFIKLDKVSLQLGHNR